MESKDQLVSLKVMRLLKPSLYCTLPVYTESKHLNDNFSGILIDQAFNINQVSTDLNNSFDSSQTDFLVIPQIFGNLYIGETFTSYICLYNQSIFKVKELSIKIELQTNLQKIPLKFVSSKSEIDEFEPDEKFDGIVEHDVKELGNHILICMVSYMNEKNEKLSFKKFYKFMVSQPFEIQTKFPFDKADYESENNESLIFQAQVQNITNNYLLMDKVQFQPTRPEVMVERLDPIRESESSANTFDLLKPFEIKQFMFKLSNYLKKEKIGKLDISWRYSFGEHGHLQTHPLELPPEYINLSSKEIELKVKANSNNCLIDEAVALLCEILNKSDRELDLVMNLENNNEFSFLWNCCLKYEIGKIKPNSSLSIELNVVPLRTGLLNLSGITITDILLKRKHEFSPYVNLFVVTKTVNNCLLNEKFSEC